MINAEIKYTLGFVSFLGKVRKIEYQRMNVYHEARILQAIDFFDDDPALIAMKWLPRLSIYTRRYAGEVPTKVGRCLWELPS